MLTVIKKNVFLQVAIQNLAPKTADLRLVGSHQVFEGNVVNTKRVYIFDFSSADLLHRVALLKFVSKQDYLYAQDFLNELMLFKFCFNWHSKKKSGASAKNKNQQEK